jgi:glutamate racemase
VKDATEAAGGCLDKLQSEAGRVADMLAPGSRDYRGRECAGRREVIERESRASAASRANDHHAGVAGGDFSNGSKVRLRPCEDQPSAGEGAEGRRAVGGEKHCAPAGEGERGSAGGRVPVVETLRPKSADLAEKQSPFSPRPFAREFDLVHDQDVHEAPAKQRRDGRGRTKHVDNHIAVGCHREPFRGCDGDIDKVRHRRSIGLTATEGTLPCNLSEMDARPVGIFDSGVGGLSVTQCLRRMAPAEDVVYFADTAYFPYGPRPAAEVRKRSFAVTNRLLAAHVKMVVVACNTASAAAIEELRHAFSVPFVGMVPGVKPAASSSRTRRVAILATAGTLDGELMARVIDEFGRGAKIVNIPGTGLAELVEDGRADSAQTRAAVRSVLAAEVRAGADTLVLGCTHYHFLAGAIRAEFPDLQIVDTSEAVARRAAQVLAENDLAAPVGRSGELRLIISGDRERFRASMAALGFERASVGVAP